MPQLSLSLFSYTPVILHFKLILVQFTSAIFNLKNFIFLLSNLLFSRSDPAKKLNFFTDRLENRVIMERMERLEKQETLVQQKNLTMFCPNLPAFDPALMDPLDSLGIQDPRDLKGMREMTDPRQVQGTLDQLVKKLNEFWFILKN